MHLNDLVVFDYIPFPRFLLTVFKDVAENGFLRLAPARHT